MYAPEHLMTTRLLLRRPSVRDADAIFVGYAQDPEVTRYLTWQPHETLGETQDFLARAEADFREGRRYAYAITLPPSDECIGVIALSRDNAFCMHLGYVLRRDRWNCGITTEAGRA